MTFKFVTALTVLALAGSARAQPAPDQAASPEASDLDGDGDVDDDDLVLAAGSETIEIVDKSEGEVLEESARAVTVIDLRRERERTSDLGEVLSRSQGLQVRRTGGL